jgi:hypothetical protein
MTRDDIIRMAREAFGAEHKLFWMNGTDEYLQRFANLVAAAEREACVKMCKDIDAEYGGDEVLATWCSDEIAARGAIMSGNHNKHQKPDNESKMSNAEFVEAELFQTNRAILIQYLQVMMDRSDWHGVSDAANDLRVLEAEYKGRK